jgi:hypothetical protein
MLQMERCGGGRSCGEKREGKSERLRAGMATEEEEERKGKEGKKEKRKKGRKKRRKRSGERRI